MRLAYKVLFTNEREGWLTEEEYMIANNVMVVLETQEIKPLPQLAVQQLGENGV